RTVLQDDDLVVSALTPIGNTGFLAATIMNTANGQVSAVQPPISVGLPIGDDRIHKLFAGRFYQSDHDLLMGAVPEFEGPPVLSLTDGDTTVATLLAPSGANGDVTFSAAVGDFTGDGYADFAVNFGPGDETGKMVIFSGANPDGSQNLRFGPARTQADGQETLLAMTAGDFNGDGRMEIAGLAYKRSGKYTVVIYTVDPTTLAISKAAELVPSYTGEDPGQALLYFSMASGHFTSATHNQVVLAYARANTDVKIEVLDFAPGSLQPIEASIFQTASGFLPQGGFIQVETGRFTLASPYDQLFFGFAWNGTPGRIGEGIRFFLVFQVDPSNESLTPIPKSFVDISDLACLSTFSVGNYDKKTTDSSGKTQPAFGLQVAVAGCTANLPGNTLRIYGVNPADYSTNLDYTSALPSNLNSATALYIDPADLQGRSYLLGPPAKVVVNQSTQPSVVLAMPPMHVDWIAPVNSQTPELLNVSASPSVFKTSYQVDASKADQSSTSDTTSFSFGAKETAGASFSIGSVAAGEGLQIKDVFTATQQLKSSVQNESGTTHQESFKLSASTTAGDYVLYTDTRLNIWVYPVIGQTVCSATTPNCQPSEKVPLTIQFSIPDQTSSTFGSGINMEWYQPPWEPFNVLSYPANLQQLQTIYPNLQQIATTTAAFTDQGQLTQQVTWVNGSTTSQTASFDQNNSYENDLSINGAVGIEGLGFGFQAGLDLSGSQGFSQLNKAVTSYSSSTGIGVSSLGRFLDPPNYRYALTPIIFGSVPPAGAVDSSPLNTDVQAYGLIRTAFMADPARPEAGGWWRQAYYLPDVALNRPAHWQLTGGSGTPNCLGPAPQSDCFAPGTFAPQTPWTSEFHFMRGFFISNDAHPGQGPQLSLATAGDKLTLQARVYNYSLTPMPDNTTVHVRFYAQPLDTRNLPSGNSIFIGEDTLAGIPPFDDTPGAPLNWTLASAHFDTSPYAGVTVAFWVVVWMQGPDGKMVTEMPDHGLKAIPGTLTSLADVQTEGYSNNVGLYKVAFPILPASGSASGLLSAVPNSSSSPVAFHVGKVGFSMTPVVLHQPVEVYVPVSAQSSDALGVTAQFYEGDPKNGGELLDTERLAYLNADQTYEVRIVYRAHTCGTHELFVVVNKNLPNEVVRRAQPVRVDCSGSMLSRPLGWTDQKPGLQ
ncbi:MAG: VCBS repeat-containing protein, partial [Acidobacteriaceae bacterium]|nr:VCBS repeat-containing protein [Acidobacteriaceae bacterium]